MVPRGCGKMLRDLRKIRIHIVQKLKSLQGSIRVSKENIRVWRELYLFQIFFLQTFFMLNIHHCKFHGKIYEYSRLIWYWAFNAFLMISWQKLNLNYMYIKKCLNIGQNIPHTLHVIWWCHANVRRFQKTFKYSKSSKKCTQL